MCPYGGTTPEQDKKIDSCIRKIKGTNKRTGKPYTKNEKVAICKAQVLKSEIVIVEENWYAVVLAEKLCESTVEKLNPSDFIVTDDEDGIFDSVVESAKLTHQQRKGLGDSAFCLIQRVKGKSGKTLVKRRFPAQDAAHVRNGLARLPQAKNLSPSERAKVKSCLTGRAKKHGIQVSSTLEFEPVQASMLEACELEPEEIEAFQSITPTENGTFWVMAGMEGQSARYMWERYTVAKEFFEKRYKKFKGKFYYLGHERRGDITARVAKIVKSELRKVGTSKKIGLFHEIKPKTEVVSSDIIEGYLSDVSIDAFEPIMSEKNDKLIVDGEPYGVAFVAALPKMKGCPRCKVMHDPTESCITSDECPSGTTEVSGQINEVKEVTELTDKEKNDAEKNQPKEPSGIEASGSGVPDEKYKAMESEVATLRAEMNEQKFGNAVSALAKRAKVEDSVVMSIVTDNTSESRMNSLESLIKAFEEEKKKVVESAILEDPKKIASGSGEKKGKEGEYTQSAFERDLAELEGRGVVAPPEVPEETVGEEVGEA